MSDEMELAPEEKRPTAAELKAQIEDKQRELKAEAKVSEPAPASEPIAPTDPASAANASILDKPTEPAGSSAVEAPAPIADKPEDVPEIVKKKGWKDVDAFLKSYRELEKKVGEKKLEPQAQPYYAPPVYQPPMPQARPGVADIAQRYGMAPEDLERLAPLIGDLSESIAERKFRALEDRLVGSERERQREKEIDALKTDPAFQNPEVLSEMGLILESQPQLAKEQNGLTFAFNQALASVGRKRLEGTAPSDAPSKPTGPVLPKTPPTTARGTGPTAVIGRPGISAPSQMNPANFSSLPLAEKLKVLKATGAIREE